MNCSYTVYTLGNVGMWMTVEACSLCYCLQIFNSRFLRSACLLNRRKTDKFDVLFEVSTALLVNPTVLGSETCSLINCHPRFGVSSCIHLQGTRRRISCCNHTTNLPNNPLFYLQKPKTQEKSLRAVIVEPRTVPRASKQEAEFCLLDGGISFLCKPHNGEHEGVQVISVLL